MPFALIVPVHRHPLALPAELAFCAWGDGSVAIIYQYLPPVKVSSGLGCVLTCSHAHPEPNSPSTPATASRGSSRSGSGSWSRSSPADGCG